MHIPDGFVEATTAVAASALGATGLAIALQAVQPRLPSRQVPLLRLATAPPAGTGAPCP